jgi:hypothetical protein
VGYRPTGAGARWNFSATAARFSGAGPNLGGFIVRLVLLASYRFLPLSLALTPALLLACSSPRPPDDGGRASRPPPTSPVAAAVGLDLLPSSIDARGVPLVLRATSVAPAPAASATEAALGHLGRIAGAWGVARTAMPDLVALGEVPAPGGTIVRVRQELDGLPIDRGELRVMVRADGGLIATSGALASAAAPRSSPSFPIDDAQAIASAVAHAYGRPFDASSLAVKALRSNGTRLIRGRQGDLDVQLARARKAWHDAGDLLVPAWIVEAYAGRADSTDGDAFRTVLSADGRRVLSHRSLVESDAFSYRVFAEPTGELHPLDGPLADYSPHPTGMPDGTYPAYVASSLITVEGLNHPPNSPVSDPWLDADRTETLGNNVEAYSDVSPPTGFTFGDFRATTTGARAFDRAYDVAANAASSQAQQMASITSAFYGINWLHDFWYDAGFTEVAGNGQESNLGRGGEDRDALLAETQDNFPNSINNANMSTPDDGLPPRMQIFAWMGKEDRKLTILPAGRTPAINANTFGPFAFDISAPIVLAVDATAPTSDACQPLTNAAAAAGKLVLVDNGNCSYKRKLVNLEAAGAAGMILAHTTAGAAPPRMGNDTNIPAVIGIGAFSVTLEEGTQIKAELAAGPVTATAHRTTNLLDGGIDSTLLAHEFGHYVHHRLQDCGTRWCSAMSEGWGDFLALLLMIRGGDNYSAAYPFSIYTTQAPTFSPDPAYFGIRRAPYSVNQAINSLSYRHMANGEPLPTTHPFQVFGVNSEVHNAGEIWAQTMHEVYVALLQAPGATFSAVRAKMARYVVAGLMMAPRDSTPTEMRDALYRVALPEDRDLIIGAFARRGMGSCATTPASTSTDFIGIVESKLVRGRAASGPAAIDDQAAGCDSDRVLDAGEAAVLRVPVLNVGHAPLSDVRITVTAMTPGLTVMSQPATIASIAAQSAQDAAVEVKLDASVRDPLIAKLAIKIESSDGCELSVDSPAFEFRANVDDVPSSSATDSFDAEASVWTPSEAARPLWTRVADTLLDRRWHGADAGGISDTKLESPELQVGTASPLKVSFSHRYRFEFSDNTAWDGGVIEYSTDRGATWQDVASLGVAPGYGSTALTRVSSNPLGGRLAFSGASAGYPAYVNASLDFGLQLAGKTVKLRFRIGTDEASSAEGWDIDDLAFEGLVGTPFPAQVPDRTETCSGQQPPPPDGGTDGGPDDGGGGGGGGGCCDAGPLRRGELALAAGVLGLLLRRRRRAPAGARIP